MVKGCWFVCDGGGGGCRWLVVQRRCLANKVPGGPDHRKPCVWGYNPV